MSSSSSYSYHSSQFLTLDGMANISEHNPSPHPPRENPPMPPRLHCNLHALTWNEPPPCPPDLQWPSTPEWPVMCTLGPKWTTQLPRQSPPGSVAQDESAEFYPKIVFGMNPALPTLYITLATPCNHKHRNPTAVTNNPPTQVLYPHQPPSPPCCHQTRTTSNP